MFTRLWLAPALSAGKGKLTDREVFSGCNDGALREKAVRMAENNVAQALIAYGAPPEADKLPA